MTPLIIPHNLGGYLSGSPTAFGSHGVAVLALYPSSTLK